MSVLKRSATRTIKNSTETTGSTDSVSDSAGLAFALTTSDAFYVGTKQPFASRYFEMFTANENAAALTVEYWNGGSWAAVEDLIDPTNGFRGNGFISWVNPGDWKKSAQAPINDVELFWIRIKVSANLSAGTTLQSVVNLFCDADLLGAYYPELVSDTRYYPSGKTTFMEQFVAAKDLVVTRLKQDHLIADESEILDINEVAIAAVHATAWIIIKPIARDDGDKDAAAAAYVDFNKELNQVKLSLDFDNSGTITDAEEHQGNIFRMRG